MQIYANQQSNVIIKRPNLLLRAPDNHRIIKRIHFHEKKEMARIAVKVSQRPGESNTNLHLCCEYVTGGLL